MPSWILRAAILALSILPLAHSQFISSLPQCVQNCINQSDGENCSVSDIKCLCRASAGNFLPDLITCMHGNCDNGLDNDVLLTPLQLVCQVTGTPIPASAIRNAENRASSLASQVTTTVTRGGEMSGSAEATTTSRSSDSTDQYVSTASITTTHGGLTISIVFPVTIERTTKVTGSPSTRTISAVSTSSASTPASSTNLVASSTDSSTWTITTSIALASASSSGEVASKSSSVPSEDSTNSSPFKDSNSGSAQRSVGGNWLGLAIVVVAVRLWF